MLTSMFKKANVKGRDDLANWWQNRQSIQVETNGAETLAPTSREETWGQTHTESLTPTLTHENKVIALLEQGLTTDELAFETGLSASDVSKILQELTERAGLKNNRTALIKWWKGQR